MRNSFMCKTKKLKHRLFFILMLMICFTPLQLIAADMNLVGFGSIGGGQTLSRNETFLASPITNTFYDHTVSFDGDTCIGLQSDIDLLDRLSATIQIISRGGSQFDATFEWAFLSYELTHNLSFIFGKRRMPLFMHSQNVEVGYTYHWIRPPNEVYYVSSTYVNGPSLLFRDTLGLFEVEFDLYYGASESEEATASGIFSDTVIAESEDILGITARFGFDPFRIYCVYEMADTVLTGIEKGEISAIHADTYTLGMIWDIGCMFIHTEIIRIHLDGMVNSNVCGYGSFGFRIGAFTPHITYGEYKGDDDNIPFVNNRHSLTIGLRYDFHPSAAFKIEYSTLEEESDPLVALFDDSEAVSFAVDFLF